MRKRVCVFLLWENPPAVVKRWIVCLCSCSQALFPLHQLEGNLETTLGGCVDSAFENGLGKHSVRFFPLSSPVECVSLITVCCIYEKFEVDLSRWFLKLQNASWVKVLCCKWSGIRAPFWNSWAAQATEEQESGTEGVGSVEVPDAAGNCWRGAGVELGPTHGWTPCAFQ